MSAGDSGDRVTQTVTGVRRRGLIMRLVLLLWLCGGSCVTATYTEGESAWWQCPAVCLCDGPGAADCSGTALSTVPTGLSAFTRYLDLSMNNITELPASVFQHLLYLEELRLAGNDLNYIHPQALSGLYQLKVLMLQNNQLKTVPSQALKNLHSLQSLRLDANHITAVPEESFEGLAQLRYLWLDDNNLSDVPVGPLSNLGNLQALTVALNRISYIPDEAFVNLSSLVVLHLHNNKITDIGRHCFTGLENLETLDLNFNSLALFPEAIQSLPKLKELGFHSNAIEVIPERAFHRNPLLRAVQMYDNPLSSVGHSAFQNLSDLHSLMLRGVSMMQDFPNLEGIISLENLVLTGTEIRSIPEVLCDELRLLRLLDLSYNRILELPSFQRCFRLEEINLQHNLIQQVQADTFQGLSSLRLLDLSRNKIKFIHREAFLSLRALANLDLSLNSLSSVPTAGLRTISQLKLVGNPQLKDLLVARNMPSLRTVSVPYAYQCCAFIGCERPPRTENTAFMATDEDSEVFQLTLYCTPSPGAFQPCENLLGSWMIRLTLWFVCLAALVSNTLVLWVTFLPPAPRVSVSPVKLLVGLLAAANLGMGLYVGVLATLEVATWGAFAAHGVRWETGVGCRVAGFLAIWSSEASVLLLALAAVERSAMRCQWGQGSAIRVPASLVVFGAAGVAAATLFMGSEFPSSPLCLPFPATSSSTSSSLGFTVALVLLNSLAYLLMVALYSHLYCTMGKEAELSDPLQVSSTRHVAWLIFTDCLFFCPVAAASFGPLLSPFSPDVTKSLTLIFFPLPACANPALYIFFNPHFKQEWCRLWAPRVGRSRCAGVNGDGVVGGGGGGDCRTYTAGCSHLVKSLSCPALLDRGPWSDCAPLSSQPECANEGDSIVSDSSDHIQDCGRTCFCQSRAFPLAAHS